LVRPTRGDGSLADSVRRLLSAALRGESAVRDITVAARLCQAPVRTNRRMTVTSIGGGTGKTTVAALLALTFADRRGQPILAVPTEPGSHALAWRLGVSPGPDLVAWDHLVNVSHRDPTAVDRVLLRTPGGVALLPPVAAGRPLLAGEAVMTLGRPFAVTVLDGGRLETGAARTAAAVSHVHVVVVAANPDGMRGFIEAMDGPLAGARRSPNVLVVANATSREGYAALTDGALRQMQDEYGLRVLALPFDRHLATGCPVDAAALGEDTVAAATLVAGTALQLADQA
jgi:hypothetical protein